MAFPGHISQPSTAVALEISSLSDLTRPGPGYPHDSPPCPPALRQHKWFTYCPEVWGFLPKEDSTRRSVSVVMARPASSPAEGTNCSHDANGLSQRDAGGTRTAHVGEQCLQVTPCCEDQTMKKVAGMLLPPS